MSQNESESPGLAEMELVATIVQYGRERGANVEAVLAGLDMEPEDLKTEGAYVDSEQWFRVQVGLADALDDALFGLRLSQYLSLRSYGFVGVLYELSPSLRAALERLGNVLPKFMGSCRLVLDDVPGGLRVTYQIQLPDRLTWVHRQELIGGILTNARRMTGVDFLPLRVCLRQREAPAAALREYFGVEVELGAEADAIVLPAEVLDIPCRTADATMLKFVLDAMEAQLARRQAWLGRSAARLKLDGCVVDLANGRVERDDGTVWLTSKERELLEFFAARPNQVVSHAEIERSIWRLGSAVISHAPAVAVRRLRQKIEPRGSRPVNLVTMFGDGWKLVVRS